MICLGLEIYGTGCGGFISDPPIYKPKKDPKNSVEFEYESDFDENGLLFYLGTNGNTQPYVNPHVSGNVIVKTSVLKENCKNPYQFASRKLKENITKSHPESFMMINLIDVRIKVTCYTIGHVSDNENENCLRSWDLEASHDGRAWITIDSQKNNTLLSQTNDSKTFNINNKKLEYFQYFKLVLTGPNSSNNNCLSCAGIELYGFASGGVISNAPTMSPPPEGPYMLLQYKNDFDKNGLLYFIGTKGASQSYQNPAIQKLITVKSCALTDDSNSISCITGRKPEVYSITKSLKNSWISINLIKTKIRLTHYSLRHYNTNSESNNALLSWKLEGKNKGGKWKLLSYHENDTSLISDNDITTKTYPINTKEFFEMFSLMTIGKNNINNWSLVISGIEFYGIAAGDFITKSNTNLLHLEDYDIDIENKMDNDDDAKVDLVNRRSEIPIIKPLGVNPFVVIKGKCDIEKNDIGYTITGVSMFPSIRGNFELLMGDIYYEIEILQGSCIQVGFADSRFKALEMDNKGVGNDKCSWAYDGFRSVKWNSDISYERYGGDNKWKIGDIIGCRINLNDNYVEYYLNGV